MNGKFKCIRLGVIIGILFLSMLSLMVSVPDDAEAVGPTVLAEIRWNPGQEVQEADVKPGEHGTVMFSGVVNCELVAGGTFQKVIVSLQAFSEQSWSPIVNPSQITFAPNTDTNVPFSVSVTVPAETSFYTMDTITVSGKGVAFPGIFQDIIEPQTATIRVKQFYKFQLQVPDPYQEVAPSERLVFNLKVLNRGNARDTFHIVIKNLEQLSKKGFTVTLSTDIVDVEPLEEEIVQIPIGTPIKFNMWLNEIQSVIVEVTSDQEQRNTGFSVPREFPMTVRQRGFSTPGFEPLFTIMALAGIAVILNVQRTKTRKRIRRK